MRNKPGGIRAEIRDEGNAWNLPQCQRPTPDITASSGGVARVKGLSDRNLGVTSPLVWRAPVVSTCPESICARITAVTDPL